MDTNNDVIFFKVWRNLVINRYIFSKLNIMEKIYKFSKGFSGGLNDVTLKYFRYPDYLTELKYESQSLISGSDLFDIEMMKRDGVESRVRIKDGSIVPVGVIPNSVKELNLLSRVNLLVGSIPNSVESIVIGLQFEQRLKPGMLPNSITAIYISAQYRTPFDHGVLPSNLKHLVLGEHYNAKLEPGVLPASLEVLDYNYSYSHNIEVGSLPRSLTYIEFSTFFGAVLPVGSLHGTKLKHIKFSCNNTGKLLNGVFPDTVEMIEMAERYAHPIQIGLFPTSGALKSLLFGYDYNYDVQYGALPSSLEYLRFYGPFNQNLGDISYLTNLKTLIFGSDWNHPLNHLPSSLQYLNLGKNYSTKIEPGQLSVCNLKYLIIDSSSLKCDTLVKGSIPDTLDHLEIKFGYKHTCESLENEIFPITLQSLVLGSCFNLQITKSLFNFNCGNGISNLKSLKLGYDFDQLIDDSFYLLDSIENLEFSVKFSQEFPIDFKFPSCLKQLTLLNNLYNHKLPSSLFTNTSLISLKLSNKDYQHFDSISSNVIIFLRGRIYNPNNSNTSNLLLDEIKKLDWEIQLPEPHLSKPKLNLKTKKVY